ncbi:MAG TPA: DoxX family protein [Firmicutes bacterium]|nr:DoxX family protein [Bacillota bacterium]
MPRRRFCNILRTILAWAVGIVFLYAAVLKIADPADFAQNIKYYKLVPLWAVNAIALVLPWWELSAALALFIPGWRRAGAAMILAMTCVFMGAVASAIVRGLDISCGCFGPYSTRVGFPLLALDFALFLIVGFVFLFEDRPRGERGRQTPAALESPPASAG